ncbi:MAG: SPOR domain-containing protein [Betaproteobacteria bacterium]|nr:SPOR domain-containing protein [Betaproteobacteria bacterium]MDE2360705.1 SPOR domain-containing protein [Betaproteobacteria bacterium]
MTAPTATRRPSTHRAARRSSAVGGTLLGVFIGIVVGLGLAAGVAYWLMRNNPAIRFPSPAGSAQEPPQDASAAAKSGDADKPRFDFYKILPGVEEPKVQSGVRPAERGDRAVAEQARGRSAGSPPGAAPTGGSAGSGAAPTPSAAAAPPRGAAPSAAVAAIDHGATTPQPGSRYWLQAGSFTGESDAENLKARLAFAGLEAAVQQGVLPDKSIRYRVRLGPYDNLDELGRMKAELSKRGFDVAVVRY